MTVQNLKSEIQNHCSTTPGTSPVLLPGAGAEAVFVSRSRKLVFRGPVEIVSAETLDEVAPCLERVEAAVAQGLRAAGFLAYEAAPAFDPCLAAHDRGALPLAWFGLFTTVEEMTPAPVGDPEFEVGPWEPLVSAEEYTEAFRRIRELIGAGDTYQVNYTFPMRASFRGNTLSWFRRLCQAQGAEHCAFIDAGRFQILSASPELFFRLDGSALETRPMKGTRPRGLWPEQDRQAALGLAESDKERAENIMIVDLLRNDMGRISETGSVRVSKLFQLERYPTVWQMTSTISSRVTASIPAILTALFPSGSVTGAPKIRTMQIIRELEPYPRGVYCGCVGWWLPGQRAAFNVGIRTVTVDSELGVAEYHVGSGITWDSVTEREYEECHAKAALLTYRRPKFDLFESLLLDGNYFLLQEHLDRLTASAHYFGFSIERDVIESALRDYAAEHSGNRTNASSKWVRLKVRLFLGPEGAFRIESAKAPPAKPVRLGLAREPVDETDVFLYHKTTHRQAYDRAKAGRPDCQDVLLWNRKGEITESAVANVVVDVDGERLTPALRCGLLPGTMRAHLLAKGDIREAILTKEDVARARALWLINSVRKWIDVDFVDAAPLAAIS